MTPCSSFLQTTVGTFMVLVATRRFAAVNTPSGRVGSGRLALWEEARTSFQKSGVAQNGMAACMPLIGTPQSLLWRVSVLRVRALCLPTVLIFGMLWCPGTTA